MAVNLSNQWKRRHKRAAVGAAIRRGAPESQAKARHSAKVKSYLSPTATGPQRLERADGPPGSSTQTPNGGELAMYIGLGGLLILILVLWLLGVI
jgi:hypothetical protein